MMLSMTPDYAADTGDPSPYLRRIAEAGFSHVHWCHHWNTDFLYSRWEIEQIATWLEEFGLRLLDLHGSAGQEKNWASPRTHERLAGVELVANRIDMTARLGADVVVMHVPNDPASTPVRKSLDELEPFAKERNVRLAIENTRNCDALRALLAEYGPDYLGLCYDSGHGNMSPDGLDTLDEMKDRLIAVHLHDNDGRTDQHNLPFSGTTDWPRLARLVARSAYTGCVSLESNMRHHCDYDDEEAFLAAAFAAATRLAAMVEAQRPS